MLRGARLRQRSIIFKIELMRVRMPRRTLGIGRAQEAPPVGSLPPHQGIARRVHRDRRSTR